MGTAQPLTDVKIVNVDTGKNCGPNEQGELCVKAPHVMKGYYNNEAATKECLKDGWLHTGDILYFDENLNLFVVDRMKEMIKVKGFQVSPSEMDDILRACPGVLDVATIGVPHEKSGEAPRAYIVKKDPNLTEQMVHDFLKDKVASFKQLDGGIEFLDELPKSPTGKILRKILVANYKESSNK